MPTDADRDQLDGVVGLVREVLGAQLAGMYLHGSAVLGGLRSRSDLDVLAVATRGTTPCERHRLVAGLTELSCAERPSGRSRPVELSIVVESEVRPWRYPPRLDFLYGEWLRAELERGLEPWETRSPDLAVLLHVTREHGAAIHGPPARELLEPVPRADVAAGAVAGVEGLLDDLEADTRNVVLTLARIWSTLMTGAVLPKHVAARWAMSRLPEEHRPVLARARAVYLGEEEERWDDLRDRVRPHADHVAGVVGRLAAER